MKHYIRPLLTILAGLTLLMAIWPIGRYLVFWNETHDVITASDALLQGWVNAGSFGLVVVGIVGVILIGFGWRLLSNVWDSY